MRSVVFFILLGAAGWLRADPVEATAISVDGKVEWAAPGSTRFAPLAAGAKLAAGSTVRTSADGTAVLVVVPGAAIRLGPKSTMVLNEMDFKKDEGKNGKRKALLDLKSGTVSALIEGNTPKTTDFTIKTPQGGAAARGTFFAVTVMEGKAYVAVKEGKVGWQRPAEKAAPKKAPVKTDKPAKARA